MVWFTHWNDTEDSENQQILEYQVWNSINSSGGQEAEYLNMSSL